MAEKKSQRLIRASMQLQESPKENQNGTTKADKAKTSKETKELIESEMREIPQNVTN